MKEHFICATETYCKLYDHVAAPYIRKSFEMPAFQRATLRICGLGFYDLFVNGKKITKGKLAPYISNPDHVAYYDEYDLTPLLQEGGNAVGVILGNGFLNNIGGFPWRFDLADFRSAPKLSLVLEADGKEILCSDEQFKTAPSPVVFDDLRCGEYYDARNEQSGWAEYGFDDSEWSFVQKTTPPKGKIAKVTAEPIVCLEEIEPVSIVPSDGGYVIDFGVNAAGVCRLELQGRCGQRITLWHGEALVDGHGIYVKNTCTPDFDRNMTQKDVLICSGRKDVFEPNFTYHGFRYVFIEGLGELTEKDFSIKMLRLGSDLQKTGTFTCTNETVDRLQKITLNSDLSNFFYFPTDCPQREKNGWTGDAVLSCEQLLYNLDCSNSMRVWLENVRLAQQENGRLPGVVPTVEFGYEWGNGPAWDMVIVELPYQIYRFTGDLGVLTKNADAIEKYLSYMQSKRNEKGLLEFGLPDWCECGRLAEGMTDTPLEVSDTLVAIDICQKSASIFHILGDKEREENALALAAQLKADFRKVWVDEQAFVKCRTQTAQSKALDVGIFDEDEKALAVKNLVALVEKWGNRFQVGVLGARVLFRALADNGYADLALEIMTKDGFPSYKYWLDQGATSLWESFNEVFDNSVFRKDGGRVMSLNHHFWGDISAWFYRYILGICVNPTLQNANEFEIDPMLLSDVDGAEGSYVRNGSGVIVKRCKENGQTRVIVRTVGNAVVSVAERCRSFVRVEKE